MDKLERTDSRLARRHNREERPVHPSTRDLVFSLATCGSLFVLGSWSLTAVGCAAGSKTNEQRMAQRRNANSPTVAYATPNTVQVKNSKGKVAPGVMTLAAEDGLGGNSPQTIAPQTGRAIATSAPKQAAKKPVYNMVELVCEDSGVENTTPSTLATAASVPNAKAYLPNGMPTMMANLVNPAVVQHGNPPATTMVTHGKPSPDFGSGYAFNPNGGNNGTVQTGWTGNGRNPNPAFASGGFYRGNGTTGNTGTQTGGAYNNGNRGFNGTMAAAPAYSSPANANGKTDTMELSRQLANAFAQAGSGSMDPMRVWFIYSSLAVSNPDIEFPQGWDSDLLPAERDRINAALSGFAALGRAFRDGNTEVDSSIRQALVTALTGQPQLTIPKVDLCTKVAGFGDYAPLARRSFLAGASNRVIVYSELDGFRSNLENGKWTTRLATRVSIVQGDGSGNSQFVAWSRTPEWTEVTDTSDSPRAEFFLGEIIPIASNLSVGNYSVRVEVKDLATGAVTSQVLPIEVLDERAFAAVND